MKEFHLPMPVLLLVQVLKQHHQHQPESLLKLDVLLLGLCQFYMHPHRRQLKEIVLNHQNHHQQSQHTLLMQKSS
jgi:hypothetical protein